MIFKSVAYCHVPDEKWIKLYQIVEKGYLVGYNKTSKAYKVYILGRRKILVRRDVNIMEDIAFRKSQEMPTKGKSEYARLFQQQ